MTRGSSSRGFTIVELLIVIVVIAILAAITVVAFNSIKTRADNATTVSGVTQYVKALQSYKSEKGEFPLVSLNSFIFWCVGEVGETCGMVQGSGTFDAECEFIGGITNGNEAQVTTLNTAIKTYLTTIPKVSQQTMTCTNRSVKGAIYFTVGSGDKNAYIRYYQKGDVPCPSLAGAKLSTRTYFAPQTTSCLLELTA